MKAEIAPRQQEPMAQDMSALRDIARAGDGSDQAPAPEVKRSRGRPPKMVAPERAPEKPSPDPQLTAAQLAEAIRPMVVGLSAVSARVLGDELLLSPAEVDALAAALAPVISKHTPAFVDKYAEEFALLGTAFAIFAPKVVSLTERKARVRKASAAIARRREPEVKVTEPRDDES